MGREGIEKEGKRREVRRRREAGVEGATEGKGNAAKLLLSYL